MSEVLGREDLPDAPTANRQGCRCPAFVNGGLGADRGRGKLVDGVREWTVNPKCAIHSDPRWWYARRLPRTG